MSINILTPTLRIVALCLFALLAARADDASAHLSKDQIVSLVSALKWQTGTITLKDGLAKINLSDACLEQRCPPYRLAIQSLRSPAALPLG